ncbi:MAG TPA: hypothetical protein DCF33_11575 [Saprospirales bacterium]|nr:hypothetical protein [Saprospirales bacterium]
MKKTIPYQASNSLLGVLLLFSILGTAYMTGLDLVANLYGALKCQWGQFSESLSMLQPHRTMFPK